MSALLAHTLNQVWRDSHDVIAVVAAFLLVVAAFAAAKAGPPAARAIANGTWRKSREASRRRAAVDIHLERSSRPLLHLLNRESTGLMTAVDGLAIEKVVNGLTAAAQDLREVTRLLRECGARLPYEPLERFARPEGSTGLIYNAEQRLKSAGSQLCDARGLAEAYSALDRAAQFLAELHGEIEPWNRGCWVAKRHLRPLQDVIWGR